MHRIAFSIPALGISIYSFNLALALACVAALRLTFWRARREGIESASVSNLAAWLMGGGLLGARLLYVLAHPETIHSVADVFKVWEGGIVYYGCLIGGLVGSVIDWWREPYPFRAMADVVAPALALGSAIGRVGCLLNGCCYGAPTEFPWAIAFPSGSLPWARHVQAGLISPFARQSLSVHPTQLYAVVDSVVLLLWLTWLFPRRRRDGEIMAWLMIVYPMSRFVVESFRADEPRWLIGLTLSQGISVALWIAGLIAWGLLLRHPPGALHRDRLSEGELVEGPGVVVPELALVD